MRLTTLAGLLLLVSPVFGEPSSSSGSIAHPGLKPLVARADAFLSAGHFSDAAKTYTEAISLSPGDYLLFYKRATAYFSLSRHPSALDDFSKVLELTSGEFDRAIMMMAKIYTKDGDFAQAKSTLDIYASKAPSSPAVDELMVDIQEAQTAAKKASNAKRAQLWTVCSEAATQALRVASHNTEIRRIRAECNLAGGDPQGAIVDLRLVLSTRALRLSRLTQPSTTFLMRIFRLAYFLLPPSQSTSSHTSHLAPLKQCLHLDPDSPSCKPAYRLAKALDKSFAKLDKHIQDNDWMGVVKHVAGPSKEFPGDGFASTFEEALQQHGSPELLASSSSVPIPDARLSSPRRAHILRSMCRAYTKLNLPKKGEVWCDALLAMSEESLKAASEMMSEGSAEVDGWIGKGEALLIREEWEDAVRAFERAAEGSGRSDRDVLGRLQKAQRLLKQSKQKDYYKVLGVARDADAKTIKKAFHKAAMTAHPDKGGSESKMATVNEAYEVLSNPELRQRFDNGDDPNDPNSQAGNPFGGFHPGSGDPFSQFFQNGHGRDSGFSFKFGH
ncbi:hypothetical protein JVT61DRAFT_3562 [Boletus reticuloceps]|uniref:J domain-containing protein n=1 Tax=Boletus reticuloceps TaxID=495285 RepID=A0A8I3A9N7_9AGAM|nr:hypothetical protein JVT61DRAFT_3562 [Boletus reticuloceps]